VARSVLSSAARASAKRSLRAFGVATSHLRRLPDFVIIGAKRGGTTSLYRYLASHPQVAPLFPAAQNIKGTHFLDQNWHRGVSWYRSFFPLTDGSRICGEASPYYLFHPLAPRRAAQTIPEARLLVLLRDPVERAYSHYRERTRHGADPLSFDAAIEAEPARLEGEEDRIARDGTYRSPAHEHLGYLLQGRYADALERWFSEVPHQRFHIELSEDFYRDPAEVCARICEVLGLHPLARERFERWNYHPGEDMPTAIRRRLAAYFAPHNARLEQLLGIDLSGWTAA